MVLSRGTLVHMTRFTSCDKDRQTDTFPTKQATAQMGNCLVSCCLPCCSVLAEKPIETKRAIVSLSSLLYGSDHHPEDDKEEHKAEPLVKPLDVIWFRGTWPESKCFEGLGHARFRDGEWSHCGIVVTTEVIKIKNGKRGRFYLWEATTGDADTGPDIETGQFTAGVQIRDLADVIRMYSAYSPDIRIGWSSLLKNPWAATETDTVETLVARRKRVRVALAQFQADCGGVGYDSSVVSIGDSIHCCLPACCSPACACCCLCGWCCCCRACLCSCRSQAKRDASFFCSEFIVRAYQYIDMGLVPSAQDLVAESVSPPALNGSDRKHFVTPLAPFSYVAVPKVASAT